MTNASCNIAATNPRPGVALINNSQTPYRLAFHRRIIREMPEIKLWSVFTHQGASANWEFEAPDEIGPVLFGEGESSNTQSSVKFAWREWKKGGRIIHCLREKKVRAVVIGGYNDAGRLRIIRWCFKHRVPCFLFGDSNIRGESTYGWKAWVKKMVVSRVLRWCSGAMACGELGKQYFMTYGMPAERIYFMPYEPDYDLIQNVSSDLITSTQNRFNLNPARRRIVYSGRLVAQKRVDLLIEAFCAIAGDRPDWDLLIVGDGELRQSLEARVLPIWKERVRWLGFVNDQSALSAVYRLSDVLVLPSDYEPWAVVINEAVAAGMAVVASDVVGAAYELVRDGVNGRVFQAGDLPALIVRLNEVTEAAQLGSMKAASPGVLADWIGHGDPVAGLRRGLVSAHVLPDSPNVR